MQSLVRDLAFALRLIRRAPAVSLVAVLTLALGIAANVAIFSVAWPVLGARLPFPNEDRLAYVLLSIERNGQRGSNPISPGDYFDLLEARSFERLAGFNLFASERNLTSGAEPERLQVGTVTEDFFNVLALRPVAGRGLDARDFAPGLRSIVLNERTWRRHFGADPNIVGRAVRMDGVAWTVVGIMPDAASIGTIVVDAWTTQPLDRATARQKRSYFLAMVGRLRPGVTFEAANAELATLMQAVAAEYPESNRMASGVPLLARAESLRGRLTGPVKPAFALLVGGAGLVLLLAGINLAGLQIARSLARRHELSVRLALGATRGHVMRQLASESLVISALAGVVGLGAAALTLSRLSRVAPTVAWYEISPAPTLPVVLFTLILTGLVGLAIGMAPAFAVSAGRRLRLDPLYARGVTVDRPAARLRTAAAGAQVAMTVVLLISAMLIAASLIRVLRVDPGFEIDRGLIADLRPAGSTGQQIAFFDQLLERVEALTGVERACAINNVPLDNAGASMTFVAEGQTDADRRSALPMGASDGCFDALRIDLLRGRPFQRTETESVTIVTESMAKALWPDGSDPVGKRIHIGLVSGPLFRVVGVVGDIRATSLEAVSGRQVWMSASRGWPIPQRVIVRTAVEPRSLARPLREVVAALNPDLALANVRTMGDIVGEATASRRFVLALLGGFASIALVLCVVGLYGVLSYQVGRRSREIGIRVALGARRGHVVRTITAQTMISVVLGIAAGAIGARALSPIIASQLFEMSATDVRVYACVAGFVIVLAALACWSPIRRVLAIDPVAVLRSE